MASERALRRGWFGRGRTRALLTAGLLLGVGAVATSAYFNAGATVSGVSVTAGTMHIDLAANNHVNPESYAWAAMDLSNLTTGDSVARVLKVSNNSLGELAFDYSVQATASGALGDALKVTVVRDGAVSGSTCVGGTVIANNVDLDGLNVAAGDDLSTGEFHDVCVRVSLPTSPGASLSSNVSFVFPANQVP